VKAVVRIAAATALVLAGAAFLASRAGERGQVRPDAPVAGAIEVPPPDSAIPGPVLAESTVGAFVLRVVSDTVANDRIVDITQNGHRVFALRAADARLELVGRDITGDHVPDAVVRTFSGGMHCCAQAIVLGLGTSLRRLGTIDGADGDIVFDDLDNDSIPEVKIGDFRFAYWRDYPFAETQVPDVVLAWRAGQYRPACDLMREDPPTPAMLTRKARELTAGWSEGDPPVGFWGYAVDLVYGGHPDIAWRFLDRAWPAAIPGKDEFTADLKEKLRGSPCWSPPPPGGNAT
jgi:hypothetical protein